MKVILLENLKKIGSIGEIIEVKRGFGRNFLISNKKALYASKENIKQVEKVKSELSKKDDEKKQNAKKILEKINNKEVLIMEKAFNTYVLDQGIVRLFDFFKITCGCGHISI